jgi:hypothetical protein
MVIAESELARLTSDNSDQQGRFAALELENNALRSALHVFQHSTAPAYQVQVRAVSCGVRVM